MTNGTVLAVAKGAVGTLITIGLAWAGWSSYTLLSYISESAVEEAKQNRKIIQAEIDVLYIKARLQELREGQKDMADKLERLLERQE